MWRNALFLMFFSLLAGFAAPWASAFAATGDPIGFVAVMRGKATAKETDGNERPLEVQAKVYQNDTIVTGSAAKVQVIFNDESIFTVGRNSEIVLDTFVYNPETGEGASLMNATKGVFKFVTGKIAKTNRENVKVNTPFATIGVRGSGGIVQVAPGGQTTVGLTQCCLDVGPRNNPDVAPVPLDVVNTFSRVESPDSPPTPPIEMTPEMVAEMNAALAGESGDDGESGEGSETETGGNTESTDDGDDGGEESGGEESTSETDSGDSAESTETSESETSEDTASTETAETTESTESESTQSETSADSGDAETTGQTAETDGDTTDTGS